MNKLWQKLGVVAFWLGWPALRVYLGHGERTRLLLVSNGDFLVLRSWLRSGQHYNLPGGGLHNSEKPSKGLLREVKEETGIELTEQQITHAYKAVYNEFGLKFTYNCFVCELPQKPPVTVQEGEITDYSWQPLAKPVLALSQDAQTALDWWRNKG